MRPPFVYIASLLWLATSYTPLAWAASPLGAPALSTGLAMQFRSVDHVLGFTNEGILVVGGDHVLKVSFVGATPVAPQADENSDTAVARSPFPRRRPLNEVHYRNLWPGIDLRYDGKDGIVRSTYTLAPGANSEAIRLSYNVPIELTEEGSLTLTFATGTMHESSPLAWQEIEGKQQPIKVAFRQHDNGELGFTLGDYDPTQPLTIDPILTWNSFLGGGDVDVGLGIATDTSGNVYVTGESRATWGAPVRVYSAGRDAFVARLNSASGALAWNTFLGGGGGDVGYGIAADASGNVYVTGYCTATWGAPVRAYTGGLDAFVARLSAATGTLTWNTFLGGADTDHGRGIATDPSGNVYVTGYSYATWGTPVRAYAGGADTFVARLSGATGTLTWNTFLGGADDDVGSGIATDASGNVYVTGESRATWGSPVRAYNAIDAFAARLDGDGLLIWNTFLGGTSGDVGYGIATDSSDNVYVTGYSDATWGAPVRAYSGAGRDAFAARLAAATGTLTWNTFLGGGGTDVGRSIATDASGTVYMTGDSTATWGAPVRAYTGGNDAFVTRLTAATGALSWNSFLGGAGTDIGYGIATNGCGNLYVTGYSDATWGAPVRAYTAGDDAFVAQINDGSCADGGDTGGPSLGVTINGSSSPEVIISESPQGAAVRLEIEVNEIEGKELFFVLNAPALGSNWSYLNNKNQWVPVPTNWAAIQPFRLAPANGRHSLFGTQTLPAGTYEFYLGFDERVDGFLNIVAGGVLGKFVQRTVQVQ